MTGPLPDTAGGTPGLRTKTSDDGAGTDQSRLDGQQLAVDVLVVLGVGHCGTQRITDERRRLAGAQIDDRKRFNRALSLNEEKSARFWLKL